MASTSKITNRLSHRNQTERGISKAQKQREKDLSPLVISERRKLGKGHNLNKSKKTIILINSKRTSMTKMKRNQFLGTQSTKGTN